jgi:drug/metabolite transporter (DMT)-like permease
MPQQNLLKWGLFILLSFVWGSSFMLMLEGLRQLSAWQVAAFRLFFAGLVVLPFAIPAFKRVPRSKAGYIVLSGLLGSFIPAFLFCLAETRLDGSFAGTLNSMTPIFVLLVGMLFFQLQPSKRQMVGIAISFTGSVLLFFSKSGKTGDLLYVSFILLATICYGLNVNMVGRRLADVRSFDIATIAFSSLILPALAVLLVTRVQAHDWGAWPVQRAILASALLGIFGTTVATVLFYVLMKKAGGVFASTVTYGIPFVAILWGLIGNEKINIWVLLSLLVILSGILMANTKLSWQQVRGFFSGSGKRIGD